MAKNSSTGKTKSTAKPAAKGNNARKIATAGVAVNRPPARKHAAPVAKTKTKSTAMGLKKAGAAE